MSVCLSLCVESFASVASRGSQSAHHCSAMVVIHGCWRSRQRFGHRQRRRLQRRMSLL